MQTEQTVVACDNLEVDCPDSGAHEIVFKSGGEEREPWFIFGHSLSRSIVLFFTQVILVFFIDIFCVVRLSLTISCEERSLYFTVLSSSLTYFVPSPERPPTDTFEVSATTPERRHWKVDGTYYLTLLLILLIVLYCLAKLWFDETECQESTVYYMILSSTLTYLIPPPNLRQ